MDKAPPPLSAALRAAIEGLEEHVKRNLRADELRPRRRDGDRRPARPWPAASADLAPPDSAIALADGLRRGAVQLEDVIARTLDRARSAEHLGAFITLTPERFRAEMLAARTVIGVHPLAGVPTAHKDIIATAGVRTTGGSRSRANWVPDRDAEVVRRLRVRGMASTGKTNTHELATGITGQVSAAGAVGNPWDPQRVTGGSSSGAAAVVAAGVVPFATATDTGGSARIPAACCGVVGFKPTFGAVRADGVIPFSWTLDHVGAIARHAVDLVPAARALGIPGARPTNHGACRGLRFAMPEALVDCADAAVASLVRQAAATLEQDGARRVSPPWPDWFDHADGIAAAIFLPEGAAVHAELLRNSPDLLEAPTRTLLESAARVSPATYRRALRSRTQSIAASDYFFEQVDILVTPALPIVAPLAGEETVALPGGPTDVRAALTCFTRLWNVCGNPVVCVPCGLADGLPTGVQFIGPPGHDHGLLGLAARYEQLRGNFPVAAGAAL